MSEEDKITANQLKDPVEMEKDHVEKDIIGQGDGSEAQYEKTTFVVDGEDDEDEEDAEEEEIGIQLGFIDKENPHNSLFLDKDWENWDGGKVGGLPIWLDPASIPDARELSCDVCKEPMCFLLQVYCPLDNVSRAFHRVVYIFSCKKRSCLDAKRGMKCFRSQLPRRNPYYEYEPTKECKVISNQSQEWGGIHLCGLCGCKATNACSNCKSTYYCSRSHQKAHWKTHKKKCSPSSSLLSPNPTDLDEAQRKYLFPENSIYVEEEEEISLPTANPSATTKEEKPANAANNALFQDMMKEGKVWDDAITTGDHPDEEKDAKLTQNDYNQALSEQIHDPIYIQFLTRIDTSGKNQVLRYCETSYHRKIDENNGWHSDQVESKVQHHGKLYTSLEMKKEEVKVPPCPHCGGPRVFEFQIMPQLLYYLNVDKNTEVQPLVDESNPTSITTTELEQEKDKVKYSLHNQKDEDLNWGVIDVYTCVNSCFDNETFQKSSEMKNPFLHSNKSEEYLHWQILPEK